MDELRTALRSAMRSRDPVATAALRSALSALDNATAVPTAGPGAGQAAGLGDRQVARSVVGLGAAEAARRELTPAEVEAVLRAEIADRRVAAEQYPPGPAAGRLRAEAEVLAAFVP